MIKLIDETSVCIFQKFISIYIYVCQMKIAKLNLFIEPNFDNKHLMSEWSAKQTQILIIFNILVTDNADYEDNQDIYKSFIKQVLTQSTSVTLLQHNQVVSIINYYYWMDINYKIYRSKIDPI